MLSLLFLDFRSTAMRFSSGEWLRCAPFGKGGDALRVPLPAATVTPRGKNPDNQRPTQRCSKTDFGPHPVG